MAVTFAKFKERVAQKLGVLAVGDSLSADDGEIIGQAALELQAMLDSQDLLTLDIENGVSDEYSGPLVDIVAASLLSEYGVPEPRRSTLLAEGGWGLPNTSIAERRLRKLISGPALGETTKAQFF